MIYNNDVAIDRHNCTRYKTVLTLNVSYSDENETVVNWLTALSRESLCIDGNATIMQIRLETAIFRLVLNTDKI